MIGLFYMAIIHLSLQSEAFFFHFDQIFIEV